MNITLKIKRFNPEVDQAPHWELYPVPAEPSDRVLDALHWVKENCDGTLALRRSCAHGICGSDAMRINGRNALACKLLIQDVAKDGGRVTIEPLLGLKVVKDLIVEMTVFFENYRAVLPYLVNATPLPENGRERRQSPAARERFDHGTKCILCAACTTSCPPFWSNPAYRRPWCRRIALSLTIAIRRRPSVCRCSIPPGGSGAAARCLTAPRRARATFPSRA
jgi:succinate dehydrogenase / fumarate reductase, iron-sulfur subunit